ncbi:MAG: DUF4331 family protein [Myxococcales bacterium]|nr:DUF4331 family protein [Myxococcales bacterium]
MKIVHKWRKALAVCAVFGATPLAFAADHIDSDALATDPAADITDVYAWMQSGKLVMVMNVAPLATTASKFSDKVQYVIHTKSGAVGLAPTEPDVNVICTFDAAQKAKCWVGDKEYVEGDASATAGISSASGKLKVFAGLRDDPFFFNLDGFKDTVATVESVAASLTFDAYGCPTIDAPTSAVLVSKLSTDPKADAGAAKDFFASKNVLSIVVEIDPTLVSGTTAPAVAVWASTNKAP